MPKTLNKDKQQNFLFEISAEVCTKLGGIHTVIKSKAAYLNEIWPGDIILIGAYLPSHNYQNIFIPGDEADFLDDAICQVLKELRENNLEVRFGFWNIEGKPKVLLLNPFKVPSDLPQIKLKFEQQHRLKLPKNHSFVNLIINFGVQVYSVLEGVRRKLPNATLIAHFHEYISAFMLHAVKDIGVTTVFTAHATVVGRWLARTNPNFEQNFPVYAKGGSVKVPRSLALFSVIESNAVESCDLFTTVSEQLANESQYLLGRYPSIITQNGLSTSSFNISNEQKLKARQILNTKVKELYPDADPNKCVYLFTSGRYEYLNKGFDLIIKSLTHLNAMLKDQRSDKFVVMFFITDMLHPSSKNFLVNLITFRLAKKLLSFAGIKLNRRSNKYFLSMVHDSCHDSELVCDLIKFGLGNQVNDNVKVILHPSFISADSPLGADYFDFVGGCDLGIFPSRYEPWGYTPAECYLIGTPTVTTSRSGFGKFVSDQNLAIGNGIFVLNEDDLKGRSETLSTIMNGIVERRQEFLLDSSLAPLLEWATVMKQYSKIYDQARNLASKRALDETKTLNYQA